MSGQGIPGSQPVAARSFPASPTESSVGRKALGVDVDRRAGAGQPQQVVQDVSDPAARPAGDVVGPGRNVSVQELHVGFQDVVDVEKIADRVEVPDAQDRLAPIGGDLGHLSGEARDDEGVGRLAGARVVERPGAHDLEAVGGIARGEQVGRGLGAGVGGLRSEGVGLAEGLGSGRPASVDFTRTDEDNPTCRMVFSYGFQDVGRAPVVHLGGCLGRPGGACAGALRREVNDRVGGAQRPGSRGPQPRPGSRSRGRRR